MTSYQSELERLSFSEAQQEELIHHLLTKKSTVSSARAPLSHRLIAVVAAISLLIGAAGAVSLAGLSPEFRTLFGITDQKQEKNLGVLPLDKVFSDKNGSGASITLKEVVADQEQLYILMEFTAPEGTVLPVPDLVDAEHGYWMAGDENSELGSNKDSSLAFFTDEACTQQVDVYGGYSYGSRYLTDDDPSDNRISLLYTVSTDRGFSEEAQYCRLATIRSLRTLVDGASSVPVLDGMDICVVAPIRSAAQSYSFYGRCPVKLGGTTLAVVDNLTISPISISVDLIIPDSAAYDAAFAQQGPWPVYVLLRDGTKVTAQYPEQLHGRLDTFKREDGTPFFRSDHAVLTLEHPIDLGEIVDIVFVGDNDPVSEQPERPGKLVHFLFSPNNFFHNTYWDTVNQIWMTTKE